MKERDINTKLLAAMGRVTPGDLDSATIPVSWLQITKDLAAGITPEGLREVNFTVALGIATMPSAALNSCQTMAFLTGFCRGYQARMTDEVVNGMEKAEEVKADPEGTPKSQP